MWEHNNAVATRAAQCCVKSPDAKRSLMRADRNATNTQAYLAQGLTRIKTSPKTKAKGLSYFSFMLPQSFPSATRLPPTNRSWKRLLINTFLFFLKVAENSLPVVLSFVVLCLTLLVLYLFALDVCKTWLNAVLLHWPRRLASTVRWMKLHEIEAQQLKKGFEDFFKNTA